MSDLHDFFNLSVPFKRVDVRAGYLNGRIKAPNSNTMDSVIQKREVIGTEYAQHYTENEEALLINQDFNSRETFSIPMECDNDMDSNNIPENFNEVYNKYRISPDYNSRLPIFDLREDILEKIHNNPCVVIQGDTGCGKTTQVSQYILEEACSKGEYCNIVCTQPRRIAAISIAKRVCSEKNWEVGGIVGYKVGLHDKISDDTRLLYCTTGVLLQSLIKIKKMSQYTHIILDEVHERDKDMDFLLIIVRRFLATNSPNTKIVLMSATIETMKFANYFKIGRSNPAAVITINRRLYEVQKFYLEDLKQIFDFQLNYDIPNIPDDMYKLALKLILLCERLDVEYHEKANNSKSKTSDDLKQIPSILIFLPGISEIENMEKSFDILDGINKKFEIQVIRLHSLISPDEQEEIFRPAKPNHRKVILATNIAESSITVPDVRYVIDFCLTKAIFTDSSTNLTSLQLRWASRANCKQRAGRAGRRMDGRVYRLVTRNFYENYMDEHGIPEMIRCPLENIVLNAKLLDMGPPHSILGLALSPPKLSDIGLSILVLKECGALLQTINSQYQTYDGDLTFIGRIMAALPLDVRVTRLIIYGYMFSMLEETIIIAAGLSVKNIFENPHKSQLAAYSQKLIWADGSGSDLIAILTAYKLWVSKKEQNIFESVKDEYNWAKRFYINNRSLREMYLLIKEITIRLHNLGIKEDFGNARVKWLEHEKSIVLKIIISGAFYPNYFILPAPNHIDRERDVYNNLYGCDPFNTVYFTNFDHSKYIGQLYVKSIKNIFEKAKGFYNKIDIKFPPGSQKVLVIFKNDANSIESYSNLNCRVPGRVSSDVYKAIKMRQLRIPISIEVLNLQNTKTYAMQKGIIFRNGQWELPANTIRHPELVVIPSVFQKEIKGQITYAEHCGKFWFQPSYLSEIDRMNDFTRNLQEIYMNRQNSRLHFRDESEISPGMLVAALRSGYYQRAKILNLGERTKSVSFQVIFIDYGDKKIVRFKDMLRLEPKSLVDIPPRVFECSMAGIQPSSINCPLGKWPDKAKEFMLSCAQEETMMKTFVELQIYSVVNGISSVIMRHGSKSVNDQLVDKGFAQYSEENYMSKMDHDMRTRKQLEANEDDESSIREQYLDSFRNDYNDEIDPPPRENCKIRIDLQGPRSPLEATIYATTRHGMKKNINIERESVNSVFLDANLQDAHDRLVVASTILENSNSRNLSIRQTTLMPNIPGFTHLMAMIFCPRMQIKRNKYKTRYISMLCGLGGNYVNEPIFQEHDMVLHLDVEIDYNDLEVVNQIRYLMDSLLMTTPGFTYPNILPKNRVDITNKIKSLIIDLLEKPRKYINIEHGPNDHAWTEDDRDILEMDNVYGDKAIFPFHSGLKLAKADHEKIKVLKNHCRTLHDYRKVNYLCRPVVCQLCDQNLDSIGQLRLHLLSKLHIDQEQRINFQA